MRIHLVAKILRSRWGWTFIPALDPSRLIIWLREFRVKRSCVFCDRNSALSKLSGRRANQRLTLLAVRSETYTYRPFPPLPFLINRDLLFSSCLRWRDYPIFLMCRLKRRYSNTISAFRARLTGFCGMLADRPLHVTSRPRGLPVVVRQLSRMWIYHSSCLHLSQTQSRRSRAGPPQAVNSRQHRPEQLLRYRHLRHLEDGHPGVGDYLGSNLYEL